MSREDFAQSFGVSEAIVSRWVSGRILSIRHKNWLKREALIKDYLVPREFDSVHDEHESCSIRSANSKNDNPDEWLNSLSNEEERRVRLFRSFLD